MIMKTIKVAAAVIMHNGKFFATQRGYGDYKDWWEFPGGKVEAGESSETALVREIEEELATKVGIDKFLCTVECDYPGFHLVMDCYLCHVIKGELRLLEAENSCWLDERSLYSVKWLPADKKVVDILLS